MTPPVHGLYVTDEDMRVSLINEARGVLDHAEKMIVESSRLLRRLNYPVPDLFVLDGLRGYQLRLELPAALRDSAKLRRAAAEVLRDFANGLEREGRVVVSDDA